ncbi:MAG: Eco57I restriction-modification methylase domain-containing protein [bacterium]
MDIEYDKEIKSAKHKTPTEYANWLGHLHASQTTSSQKKEFGQFFTPSSISEFMSTQISIDNETISILDPGCGIGILSCALVEHLVDINKQLKKIAITAYELDEKIINQTKSAFDFLVEWALSKGVNITYDIRNCDYILDNTNSWSNATLFSNNTGLFDVIISNPPYFKLSKDDARVKVMNNIINGQPNIYALFIALSIRLLKKGGEMIFITPRSFTSGRYFKLFRDYILSEAHINFIHLFNTRKETFSKDNVLQETLITKFTKDHKEQTTIISYSENLSDLNCATQRSYNISEIINLSSPAKIIHLPSNEQEERIIRLFKSWNGCLNKYGIQISTGPVVAFRQKDSLQEGQSANTASLYWLHNVVKMLADHPVARHGKEQYIEVSPKVLSSLLPNKNYVFLRRFSTKDDSSRLIAAPYFGNMSQSEYIGVENKLNYIYRPNGHMERAEVMGLSALLNSIVFDTYFRTFNGNTNVSATELREISLPPLATIKKIGNELILTNDFSVNNINKIVESHLDKTV